MGNFVVATLLLISVIIFTGVNSVIVCSICDDILGLVDSGQIDKACEMWRNKRDYIATFVRDAEIDVVNAEVDALGENVTIEDGEAEAGKVRLRDAIEEIIASEKPSFGNVF